jgi:hypothetical protein
MNKNNLGRTQLPLGGNEREQQAVWLKQLEIPSANPTLREQQLEKARLAFIHQPAHESGTERSHALRFSTFFLRSGLASCACLLLVLALWRGQGAAPGGSPASKTSAQQYSLQQDATLLRNVAALFGEQFGAYVDAGAQSQLLPAQESAASKGSPVRLELQIGSKSYKILTFAGQTISLQIDGKQIALEVLERGDGTFLILGDDFVVENQGSTAALEHVHAARLIDKV